MGEAGSAWAAGCEHVGEGVAARGVGGIARLHGVLQAGFVKQSAIGDDGAGDGDEDAAANVAHKVDDAGDLVGGFARQADIGCVVMEMKQKEIGIVRMMRRRPKLAK